MGRALEPLFGLGLRFAKLGFLPNYRDPGCRVVRAPAYVSIPLAGLDVSVKDFCSAAVRNHVKKLSLAPGDCLIISNMEILQQLQRMPAMAFSVPVIFSPDGSGMEKASRAQVLEILDRIDEAQAVAEGIS